jgi:hypothetical protein
MIELTEEQTHAVEEGANPVLLNPKTQEEFVLVHKEVFENMRKVLAPMNRGWDDPETDVYEQYRKQPCTERTPLFSLRENAIAKEPGLRYPERWPCVSRLGCSNGGSASFEASPQRTLSRGAFSAPSLVTPIR